MDFTKIARQCKNHGHVIIQHNDKNTWIGTDAAIYKCSGSIDSDGGGVLSLIGVPEEDRKYYRIIKNISVIQEIIDRSIEPGVIQVSEIPIELKFGGVDIALFETEQGAVMYDKKLIDAAKVKKPEYYLFVFGGILRLIIKKNNEAVAIISPCKTPSQEQINNLKKAYESLKLARENCINMQNEQISMEDEDEQ